MAPSLNDAVTSLGASYVIGPVDLRASYEQRNDKGTLNASTANDTKDRDTRLGVRYTLPTSTVLALAYDSMKLSDSTATGTAKRSLERKGWVLGARQPFGAHTVYGGFGKAGDITGVLAYTYNFNKEFLFETYFSQISNEKRAKYDYDSGGISPGTGAKLTALGAGLRYSF